MNNLINNKEKNNFLKKNFEIIQKNIYNFLFVIYEKINIKLEKKNFIKNMITKPNKDFLNCLVSSF